MGSEGTQDYLYGAYYQNGTNYNWYDPTTGMTSIQATPKWDEPQPILGFEGHDLQYSGLQPDSARCVYYHSEYGYTQSAYEPYLTSSYQPVPGVGPESSLLGTQVTQQYLTNTLYHQPPPVPSPGYSSLVYPSGTDICSVTNPSYQQGSIETNYLSSVTSPARAIMPSQRTSPGTITVAGAPISSSSLDFQSTAKAPKAPIISSSPLKQSPQRTGVATVLPHVSQVANFHTSVKSSGQDKSTRVGPLVNAGAGTTQVGSDTRNWGRARAFWGKSVITLKSYTSRLSVGNPEGNIIIDINNYNKADFPTDYSCARFFVIKSYSEDDVHKSIKYGVWSSTPNGNRKLSVAYEEAQKVSSKNGVKCPVFLFFSVNTSGHFCGVAEMVGPVDFDKNMDLWQQDKWPGCFPVKWHIIKDVANNSLRHILLDNNEFKPVTHSRDTQEVPFPPGMAILKIFKSHVFINSILDGFLKFEEQEKNNHRKCNKLLSSDAPLFVPTFIRKQAVVTQYESEKKQDEKSLPGLNSMAEVTAVVRSDGCEGHVPVELPQEIGVKNSNLVVRELLAESPAMVKEEADKQEKCTVLQANREARENGHLNFQPEKLSKLPSPVIKTKNKPVENGKYQSKPSDQVEKVVEKIGSLSIEASEFNEENGRSSDGGDVVTIGSMPVRVKSSNEK